MSIARIPLPSGQFAVIDAADASLVADYRWCRTSANGYVNCRIAGRRVMLHRLLANPPEGMVVDHIDGDLLNNRRANLRVCTPQENSMNRRQPRHNTSGHVGVRRLRSGRFGAYITVQKRRHPLGVFPTMELAAQAYRDAAERLHGQFARHVSAAAHVAEAGGGAETLPRAKARRGFASMPREDVLRIASAGGRSVPAEKRSFFTDRALASDAGRRSTKRGC